MKIHPSVFVHPGAALHGDLEIGKNSSIWANAAIRADFNYIKIGRYSNIQDNAAIHCSPTHPATIGDFVTAPSSSGKTRSHIICSRASTSKAKTTSRPTSL